MAFSPDRTLAYPLLEGAVLGDPDDALRIYEFDLTTGEYNGLVGFYRTDIVGNPIGDFTPINDTEFLVIERDNQQGEEAEFKKIFKIDLSNIDEDGYVEKELVVDLLNIADPNDINNDGSTTFTFPFVTIEDVVVVDENTILVANDNNYPFSMGREGDIDNSEIILLELDKPLNLDPRLGGTAITPTDSGSNNPDLVFGTIEGNEIEVSRSDRLIFAGAGNDLIDASLAGDNNRIYAGGGNDTIILGAKDRISGAAGSDRFFVTTGGDNNLTGGAGADQFWIANAQIPQSPNTITDFTSSEDVIGIAGVGIEKSDLIFSDISMGMSFSGLSLAQSDSNTLISANGSDLAILLDVESSSLSEANFVFA